MLRKEIEALEKLNKEGTYVAGELTRTIEILKEVLETHERILDEQVAIIEGEVFIENGDT